MTLEQDGSSRSEKQMSASRCSVNQNHFRSSLRILFAAFLEAKTKLWKLM